MPTSGSTHPSMCVCVVEGTAPAVVSVKPEFDALSTSIPGTIQVRTSAALCHRM